MKFLPQDRLFMGKTTSSKLSRSNLMEYAGSSFGAQKEAFRQCQEDIPNGGIQENTQFPGEHPLQGEHASERVCEAQTRSNGVV